MIESSITKKGQTTLPKPVRETLGVQAGDRGCFPETYTPGILLRQSIELGMKTQARSARTEAVEGK